MTFPNLVLLPGMDGTGVLFEPFVDVLPASVAATVHRYAVDDPLSYEALLPHVLATLPPHDPFVLVGESFSGPLALMIAATAPPRLRAVVLCASFAKSPVSVPAALHGLARGAMLRVVPFEAQVQAMLGGYATPRLRALLARAVGMVPHDVLASRVRAMLRLDATDALRRCAAPLLYLRPTRDRLVHRGSLRLILATRPDVEVAEIDGPHLVLQARPEASFRAIESFLERNARD